VITGQRHPEEGVFMGPFLAGQQFRTSFGFRMGVLPGVYFVGGGIWSNQEPNCLHRIMDAIMLRVSPADKQSSFGYADMSTEAPRAEII
jgi:lipopolysaccharide transport system ATP-binding protein